MKHETFASVAIQVDGMPLVTKEAKGLGGKVKGFVLLNY